ncbi:MULTISPECIES: helix-turn-helix domain-containing protein [unclassified Oceanobacillus]|uniref:helix-turn-helix domain-containing protein n=1 Tax=unclassified Oceanobacillus TaxID=2630292 RepID=UPI001BEA2B63|nr:MULTISPECIES: helix-turn-helix domain-containing protein [unclassified Oceanobacillus]MBT2601250.1 helix-turn-helix domain-containing protein [Oceanobacillus sp. ISL-74]MBT2653644.1 helix-turn-helix domain-containing protein [Oceanobacillus sp. ISL-73]
MSIEETFRKIQREENEKLLQDIKYLLDSYSTEDAPKTISVREAAKILGFGANKTYELIRRHEETGFPHLRDGKIIRVPYQALIHWINQQSTLQAN